MDFSKVVILQLAILAVVMESDLGRKRVTWFRVARPIIVAAAIVPIYLNSLPTTGNNLLLEAVGAALGISLGLICVSPPFMGFEWDPHFRTWWERRRAAPGKPAVVTTAGGRYAAIWIVASAARLAFSWLSVHAFPHALGVFLRKHQIEGDALTDAIIFWPLGMDIFRSVGLMFRGSAASRRGHLEAEAPAS
jgi:hypothetical protein